MARVVNVSGDKAEGATKGFSLLPAGEYIGQVIDVKDGKFKGANSKGLAKIEAQFKITESGTGEGVGRKLKDFNIPLQGEWLNGSDAFIFYQFFGALGVVFPKKGESFDVELPDNDDILGEEIGLRISIEDSNKEDPENPGTFLKANRVAGYFPASKGVKVTEPAAGDEAEFAL